MPEDSAERAYLSAEALWRLNDVDAAVKTLEAFAAERGARDASSGSAARVPLAKKIVALGARLHRHRRLLAAADEAEEEGRLQDAMCAIDAVLKMPHLEPIAWRRGDRRRDERTEGERAAEDGGGAGERELRARAYDFAGADAYPCFALSALLRRRARATLEMIADGAFGDRASAESFRARRRRRTRRVPGDRPGGRGGAAAPRRRRGGRGRRVRRVRGPPRGAAFRP